MSKMSDLCFALARLFSSNRASNLQMSDSLDVIKTGIKGSAKSDTAAL